MDRDAYFTAWAGVHGDYDPRANVLVRGWLTLAYAVARPLATLRLSPDVVTLAGLAWSAGVVGLVALDGRGWLVAAAAAAVVAGLVDSLDGAVALLTGRSTRWGFVLDSLADRVADLCFLLALFLAGADAAVCAGGGVLMLLQEYARARAGAAGMTEIGVVTVWERPTRVIVTATFLFAAGLFGDPWPALGAWAWVGLGLVGLAQLLVVIRRRLG